MRKPAHGGRSRDESRARIVPVLMMLVLILVMALVEMVAALDHPTPLHAYTGRQSATLHLRLAPSRPARVFGTEELAELLPASAHANHDVSAENPDEYDQLITYFVLSIVPNSHHRELSGTGALA